MNIHELRQSVGQEIVDYNQLKSSLKSYSHPRGKIYTWLRSGELVRVKKGLYVFGRQVSTTPFSLEVLANLIYGPSAISLNYALYYYGLIPERVHSVTSITNKRNKTFNTPVGQFTYQYLSPDKYAIGIQLVTHKKHNSFLIATPEKALCDTVALNIKNIIFSSQQDVENFMFEDLRFDEEALKKMDFGLIDEITKQYRNRRLSKFAKYLKQWRNSNE